MKEWQDYAENSKYRKTNMLFSVSKRQIMNM